MPRRDVIAIVLGGGQATPLYPLTKDRAKPAIPIGGKYRLIDIPISNCLNSGVNNIYILTQFSSASLHRHIHNAYKLDVFSHGFVYILAAQQTEHGMDWYSGSADAVRKQFARLLTPDVEDVMVLSGDHLYRMDYEEVIAVHREKRADVTIAVQPVTSEHAPRCGILKTSAEGIITQFREKPSREELEGLESTTDSEKPYLGSMGIYIFRRDVLQELLEESKAEYFGKQLIPHAVENVRVCAFHFDGYWESIGTIRSFYEANLALTELEPKFDFYDPQRRIYTRARFLPSTRADGCELSQALLSDGCLVHGSSIHRSIVGLRSIIGFASTIRDTVVMGADRYETPEQKTENLRRGRPDIGIGEKCVIEGAIIDKSARIGDRVEIQRRPADSPDEESDNFVVRDGIVVVPRDAVIYSGSTI